MQKYQENISKVNHNKRMQSDKVPATVSILCWDTIGYRHLTKYRLFIYENKAITVSPKQIAPGMEISSRTTKSQPVWCLKIKNE